MDNKKQQQEKNFLIQLLNKHKEQQKKKQIDYDSMEKKIENYDKNTPQSKENEQNKDKSKNITELAFLGALIKSCKTKFKENTEVSKDFTEEIEKKNQIDLQEINEEQKTSLFERLKFVFLGGNISQELDKELTNKSNLSLDEIEEELEVNNKEDIEIGEDIFKEEDIEIDEPEIGKNNISL